MKFLALLLALALAGCAPYEPHWEINWNGFEPIPNTIRAIEIIEENAPCPSKMGGWGGRVTFYPDPFECYPGLMVHGCMPGGFMMPDYAIGYHIPLSGSTLPDELGHYMFGVCGLGIGEDANYNYTPEFIAWLGKVRTAMQSEGL